MIITTVERRYSLDEYCAIEEKAELLSKSSVYFSKL
jgi:hypothetical protein